jgi:hypothetical protein
MKKTFDCVKMKNDIQAKRQAEFSGMTLEEQKAVMNKRLISSPILGPVYRRLLGKRAGDAELKVAEEPGEYKTRK